jgi:uncharacterized protein with PQ loop repeat
LSTWTLALINHIGWLTYGILTAVPVFIFCNAFAAIGCAATVCVMHSPKRMVQILSSSFAVAAIIYGVSDPLLLTVITVVTFMVVLPQLVAVFRTSAKGVSTTAWVIAACSSITWICWAISIHRMTVVIAHFILLPSAIVITIRAMRAHARVNENFDRENRSTFSTQIEQKS